MTSQSECASFMSLEILRVWGRHGADYQAPLSLMLLMSDGIWRSGAYRNWDKGASSGVLLVGRLLEEATPTDRVEPANRGPISRSRGFSLLKENRCFAFSFTVLCFLWKKTCFSFTFSEFLSLSHILFVYECMSACPIASQVLIL